MHTATIVKDRKTEIYHIRVSSKGPETGGEVQVIDILLQKEGESLDDFQERCVRFVNEACG